MNPEPPGLNGTLTKPVVVPASPADPALARVKGPQEGTNLVQAGAPRRRAASERIADTLKVTVGASTGAATPR
jgi:hypothetical protein